MKYLFLLVTLFAWNLSAMNIHMFPKVVSFDARVAREQTMNAWKNWDVKLPENIDNDDIQSVVQYINVYLKDASLPFCDETGTVFASNYVTARFYQSYKGYARLNTLLSEALARKVYSVNTDRASYDSSDRFLIFALTPSKMLLENDLLEKYRDFLLSSGRLKTYDREITRNFLKTAESLKKQIETEKSKLEDASYQAIADNFSIQYNGTREERLQVKAAKDNLGDNLEKSLNDLNKLITFLKYVTENQTAQIFDAYLLAEYSIELLKNVEKGIQVRAMDTSAIGHIPHLKRFLSHPEFPLRTYILTIKALAMHLHSVANEFLRFAGMAVNIDEINNPSFDEHFLTINFNLPKLIEYSDTQIRSKSENGSQTSKKKKRNKKRNKKLQSCSKSKNQRKKKTHHHQVVSEEQNVAGLEKEKEKEKEKEIETPESSPQDNDAIGSSKDRAENNRLADDESLKEMSDSSSDDDTELRYQLPEVSRQKITSTTGEVKSLGDAVYDMLNSAQQTTLQNLLELRDRVLNQTDLDTLNAQIHGILIRLNRCDLADKFLKAPHFFHPKAGKREKLPEIYIHYRVIPYLLTGIIPSGYSASSIISSSKLLRKHHGLTKLDL